MVEWFSRAQVCVSMVPLCCMQTGNLFYMAWPLYTSLSKQCIAEWPTHLGCTSHAINMWPKALGLLERAATILIQICYRNIYKDCTLPKRSTSLVYGTWTLLAQIYSLPGVLGSGMATHKISSDLFLNSYIFCYMPLLRLNMWNIVGFRRYWNLFAW